MSNVRNEGSARGGDRRFDVLVVGAGFAGLYMLYRLRELGLKIRVLEAGGGVGGTWYWNRYPGARCDVESLYYSYSFSPQLDQQWKWTERYASQPEILRYLNHVADRFKLRSDIEFDTRVTRAAYDETSNCWTVESDQGHRYSARYCVMASGSLSAVKMPPFAGLDRFVGKWYQTSRWPREEVDFTGRRVAVIGTGSTGVQVIPIIAAQAEHLYVFQRTPSFSVPAENAPLDPYTEQRVKAQYPQLRAQARESAGGIPLDPPTQSALAVPADERNRHYEHSWRTGSGPGFQWGYADLLTNLEANETAAQFIREKIRQIVRSPAVAETLVPTGYPLGTKRMCLDTGYYATFNRSNVTLVDVKKSPIEEILPNGLRTRDASYEVDRIVFAIGFDAITGALDNIDIRGIDGISLKQRWAGGPRTYLGLMTAGFPNLFMITGPGSPGVLSNVVASIEQHAEWISECVNWLNARGLDYIEATTRAQDEWVEHVNAIANLTLFPAADSWYLGANIPGKPRVFMPYVGGVGAYRHKCSEVAANGYPGFSLRRIESAVSANSCGRER
jgi:cyclohexanone monooxygenase